MTSKPRAGMLAFAIALLVAAAPALGQEQELETIERQLDASQARQTEISADFEAIERESEAISQKLAAIAQRAQSREALITESEGKVRTLNLQAADIKLELLAKQDVLAELLAGLQRLEQDPPPALVVEPGNVLDALRGAMLFGTIVPEMRADAADLAAKLARLDNIRAQTEAEQDDIRDNAGKLALATRELEALRARKKALLAETGNRLETEKARAQALADKAKSLKQLLQQLQAERQKAAAEQARLEAEAQVKERRRQDSLLKPRLAFADTRGRLDFPAQGQILRRYGEADGFGGKVKGVFVATRAGAQVTVPADGHVEFAGSFRSYGQLLILNAGGGYHVLLAGLDGITAETGQFLRSGEPVGTMGVGAAPGTLSGDQLQDGRPVLYIEFRKNGDAIDSSPWWIGGAREARG